MSMENGICEWDRSHATYLTGRSYLDPVDKLAVEMERKWGCGRLRLLVPQPMREAFDRQRYLYNQAIRYGTMTELIDQTRRMTNGWLTLDHTATEAGEGPVPKEVWETTLSNGTVLAVCPNHDAAKLVIHENRGVVVITIDEIARLFEHFQEVVAIKLRYAGAEVVKVKGPTDPLDGIDTPDGLDKELNDDPVITAAG